MNKTTTPPRAAGWIADTRTMLFHYYREEPGQAAHKPLCDGPVLLTETVRRRAAALPAGLHARYANQNISEAGKHAGICKSCANRHTTER